MSEDGAPVQRGDVLAGKYRVEQVLGVGGMGVVVAATHLQLNDKVAIKFLLPHVVQSGEHVARFLREAQAAVRIKSVHVARVSDVGVLESGSPYMVMEHLDGQDLAAVLQERGQLSPVDAIVYVLQACEAIAEAHAGGIIHRDLKPGNLFLTHAADGSPCVKVLDFGISKSTQSGNDKLTRTQVVMGSPLYMSPEQMRSARQVDQRADVWSLGVVLYELLVGEVPFVAESMPQLVALVLEGTAPKLRDQMPSLPPALEAVVARCLARDPADRYPTLAPLAADLAAVLGTNEARLAAEKIARILDGGAPRVDPTAPLALERVAAAVNPAVQTAAGMALGRTDDQSLPPPVAAPKRGSVGRLVLVGAGVFGVLAIAGGIALSSGRGAPAAPVSLPPPGASALATASTSAPALTAAASSLSVSATTAIAAAASAVPSGSSGDVGGARSAPSASAPPAVKPRTYAPPPAVPARPSTVPSLAPSSVPSTAPTAALPDDWARKG